MEKITKKEIKVKSICVDKDIYNKYSEIAKDKGWKIKKKVEKFMIDEIRIFGKPDLDDGKNQELDDFQEEEKTKEEE